MRWPMGYDYTLENRGSFFEIKGCFIFKKEKDLSRVSNFKTKDEMKILQSGELLAG